ncbi:hypothetical protein PSI19_12445 [Xenorhabdus khoisanae]|uniref:hypothetical protein n=1 Tax=Xenorhabdus khoisanae TaxID=880157 RepID=UPI00235816A1|nr:hypothetical protein [Xenorhabdus khoisanae]MDC9614659.1 hypothetical protein [Xenorhabdus khoisanae]
MNIYILVEGKQTERKVYPAWLEYLAPSIRRVANLSQLKDNNYYLISGQGYPHMLDNMLKNSLLDINQYKKFDVFWIILDSDFCDLEERKKFILDRIKETNIDIGACYVEIIFQNPCIETWALGNKSMISHNKLHAEFSDYFYHFNVKDNDPELMKKPDDFSFSDSAYHGDYLKAMLSVRGIRYTKKNPQGVIEKYYLDELIERAQDGNGHLKSFFHFYQLASSL